MRRFFFSRGSWLCPDRTSVAAVAQYIGFLSIDGQFFDAAFSQTIDHFIGDAGAGAE
ncbi:hypothetical protein RE6C_03086 [Rhodopirellula europaea 6C]|uniref:Uncharacterized protein n=1 Tax=Rhodopirellula europaea 6C TaxID=1263867 RepID=M2ATY0_9BACT|nr:hypothetical protein RE6C_03086 [Rhodopirellula europaea 6C]